MTKKFLGPLCLALAASIWGGMYVVSKVVLTVIPPLELVWIRYLVALLTLSIIGLATRQTWTLQKRDVLLVFGIGLIGYAVSIAAQFIGTDLASAQMGAVLTASTPAFMVVFARILLKEKVTWPRAISVLLATSGVLLIVGGGGFGGSNPLGGAVLMIAALTWAFMSVLVKRVPESYSPLVITTYAILFATVILTPFTMAELPRIKFDQLVEPKIWLGVLYLGVISTAGAFFLWNKGLQLVDAGSAGLYFFFQPLVGTLFGWLLLGEHVGLPFWFGAAMILGGVLFVVKEP